MARVALITGALSDIGRVTAAELARAGFAIALNHRHGPEQARALAEELVREHQAPAAVAIPADVRLRAEVAMLFDRVAAELGQVDVLVNNAGINRDAPFLELSEEDWETVTATILGGTFACSQEFARRYRGESGNIVNIGAVTGLSGRRNGANYCSARAAVLVLTRCMALELAPRIRVNTVTPGKMDTEEVRTRYRLDDPEAKARFAKDVPLQRMGRPEDVAEMIAFLVSADRYVTGQNVLVDGGLLMR
ncbi:MAG: SDR family NAD(P)-dependent oxidoreductase [Gaiellaceae bacterium]